MTPTKLQQLLVARLPEAQGIASAEVWPQRPYGLTVALAGGASVHWMVTGASGVAPTIERKEPDQAEFPDLTTSPVKVADIELALQATILRAAEGVLRVSRYSTRPEPPAVVFGLTVDCSDGWRLFVSAVGTSSGPGDRVRPVAAGATV
ncbi:hypothetical protein ACFW1A_00665 [Kitasatospora sp. NPDC058965]|uniref:hypothetical protein n=1 Tax=Kitasatospora sp. NPDC058965 TaxID=3346682 RepID=UPI00367F4960